MVRDGRLAERAMRVVVQVGGTRQEVRVLRSGRQLKLTMEDGRQLRATVENNGDGTFTVEHDGRRLECAGALMGAERQLWVAGRTLRYRRSQPGGRGDLQPDRLPMTSAIPAVVREVLVSVGDRVEEGQKLLLLESMKMVLPIVAPRDGRVQAILCALGESVAPGVRLVELESD